METLARPGLPDPGSVDQPRSADVGRTRGTRRLLARLRPGARVLELGSGTGLPTAAALTAGGCVVTGLDGSAVMVALARRNVPGATFLRRDIAASLSGLGYYDAVVAFSLLALPSMTAVAVLEAVRLALRPGGYLALGTRVPQPPRVPTFASTSGLGLAARPASELVEVLGAAGFHVASLDLTYHQPDAAGPKERQIVVIAQRTGRGSAWPRPDRTPAARQQPAPRPGHAPRPAARTPRAKLVSSTSPTAGPARPATPRLPCSPWRAR